MWWVRYSARAQEHANIAYENYRHQRNDCKRIAENTVFTIEQVSLVKVYIFYAYHDLPNGFKRFYPCYEMAESWRRLSGKDARKIQKHDILLLQH